MSFKVVDIKEMDNFKICDLYDKAFGKPMSESNSTEIYSWLFFNNVYKKNYTRALLNRSLFLAYWGFIPVKCKMNNGIVIGSLSCQLVSSQEVLGATLLLWKKIKKELIKDDVVISFTINNENSRLLLKSLGWNVESNPIVISIVHPFILINDFICRLIDSKTIKKFFSSIFLSLDYFMTKILKLFYYDNDNDNVFEVSSFNGYYNQLWDIMSQSVDYGVILDSKYVNWRYINKPNNTYKILSYMDGDRVTGYLIYESKRDFGTHIGYIMDIIADPNNDTVINSLIHRAKKELFNRGVTLVSALSFKENIFYQNYKDTAFYNVSEKFLPHKSYFSINNIMKSDNDYESNKWHISWGNHDNI